MSPSPRIRLKVRFYLISQEPPPPAAEPGAVLSAVRAALADAAGESVAGVASTLLALSAWSLQQQPAPPPAALQQTFRSLVGRALA